jgi:predicted small secreted protein
MTQMKTNSFKTRFILSLLALATIIVVSSCRTMRGLGQDVQHAGHHIERAAH